jgi:hypothetical protein
MTPAQSRPNNVQLMMNSSAGWPFARCSPIVQELLT